jgi:hypothetical protein
MVKALIVLFTLCGQPMFITGHDINGSAIIGTPGWIKHTETATDILNDIASVEDAQIIEVKWEDVTGGQCT